MEALASITEEQSLAITEWQANKQEIQNITDPVEKARRLSQLQINQMSRRSPVAALFDTKVMQRATGVNTIANLWDWTQTQVASGRLVNVGRLGALGADVHGFGPGDSDGRLGVAFSRSE
jgi:hypothetical protein